MVRGPRNRAKLRGYYDLYMETGRLDPNVNPEIAASWEKSRRFNPPTDRIHTDNRLSTKELADRQRLHWDAMQYLKHLTANLRDFFKEYDISLLLLDNECVILKSYTMPFYQMTPGEIEGVRVGVEDIGTSSISLAYDLQAPFWVFGPEMWVQDSHESDACSAPIFVDNKMCYIITMVGMHYENMPQEAVMAVLKTLCFGLEQYLQQRKRLGAQETILDMIPFAVYHVVEDDQVAYANKLGKQRMKRLGVGRKDSKSFNTKLSEVLINYKHTPVSAGFQGISTHNKEVTWITPDKSYEDITTVVPFERDLNGQVRSVVTVSMPIEDLRTMVAHAAGFTAKYSLASLVCEDSSPYRSVRDRAMRVARLEVNVLLQGESGTGKQRMAHGIHQASSRANGPFITMKCSDAKQDLMEQEIFGGGHGQALSHPGKLELAEGGTFFVDEIDKMPIELADKLAEVISTQRLQRIGEDTSRRLRVRLLASSDCDLKRAVERGSFSKKLYDVFGHHIVRVTALRNRKEDIGILADSMLSELAESMPQRGRKRISPEAVKVLADYEWPGNIKQLQNVMENIFLHSDNEVIQPEDVDFTGDAKANDRWKVDKEAFVKLWSVAGGNISRMANALQVSRVTLYRYLKKYGLEKNKLER